jgi:hypothetical protein
VAPSTIPANNAASTAKVVRMVMPLELARTGSFARKQ